MTQLAEPDDATATEAVRIAHDALGLVEGARFHLRKKGYDPAEVDAFLQRCATALEQAIARERARAADDGDEAWRSFWQAGGDPELFVPEDGVAALLGTARFHLRKKGYDPAEVDALLGRLHDRATALDGALDRSRSAAPPPSSSPAPGPTSPESESEPEPEPEPEPAAAQAGPGSVVGAEPHPLPEPARPVVPAAAPDRPTEAPTVPEVAAGPLSPTETVVTPPAAPPASAAAADPASAWDDLVRQVVHASVDGGVRHVVREVQARAYAEAEVRLRAQEDQLERARVLVEEDCNDLRAAAAEQCTRIVVEAERRAERALAEIHDGVRVALAKVCSDAREELERIAADQIEAVERSRPRASYRIDGPPPVVRPAVEPRPVTPRTLAAASTDPDDGGWVFTHPLPRRPT